MDKKNVLFVVGFLFCPLHSQTIVTNNSQVRAELLPVADKSVAEYIQSDRVASVISKKDPVRSRFIMELPSRLRLFRLTVENNSDEVIGFESFTAVMGLESARFESRLSLIYRGIKVNDIDYSPSLGGIFARFGCLYSVVFGIPYAFKEGHLKLPNYESRLADMSCKELLTILVLALAIKLAPRLLRYLTTTKSDTTKFLRDSGGSVELSPGESSSCYILVDSKEMDRLSEAAPGNGLELYYQVVEE